MSHSQHRVRPAAVAGLFYPGDAGELRARVRQYISEGQSPRPPSPCPRALIAPHAGYPYSGPIAGSGYALLALFGDEIRRVVMLGPAHRLRVDGIAASTAKAFATPLGEVPVDLGAVEQLLLDQLVVECNEAHAKEHCLEVHLPFLQELLPACSIVPLLVGQCGEEQVAELLERFWGQPETLILISSDLSHYHDYASAERIDSATCESILRLDAPALRPERACGYRAIQGVLRVAQAHGATPDLLDRRSSGDTAGSRDEVVGYAAISIA